MRVIPQASIKTTPDGKTLNDISRADRCQNLPMLHPIMNHQDQRIQTEDALKTNSVFHNSIPFLWLFYLYFCTEQELSQAQSAKD
ncbi:hypothetical protein DS165_06375 [Salmonella enterica subsp. enterica serovar Newport]|nr:hypothetical protein [Salmonella enterica subsp. enterica serovar Newport]EAS2601330.1 hypothetical protein [Salmonella enterica]EBU9773919.1 hypothetical protein [Salmonella enterica subsp. enterica serovar Kumasi]EBX0887995.1 hypothetical protein [Salmonella enterica subsp. enterica serovar Oslo]EBX7465231.1 hypothetical protein [Salmonella enterica subsp. enterica serovar Bareilly]ECU9161192.1 hypothetical protein [Salmonella enterica subsp. enterica serovar Newport str. CFSAN000599]